jgi:UDP-N-acetylglucosamine 2-epimerase
MGRAQSVFRETLGMALYPSALRLASVLVGNSSSGLIEAPFAGLPVIDVGQRQDGRLHGRNLIRLPADRAALAAALTDHRRQGPDDQRFGDDLYGDGASGPRIIAAIDQRLGHPDLLTKRLP